MHALCSHYNNACTSWWWHEHWTWSDLTARSSMEKNTPEKTTSAKKLPWQAFEKINVKRNFYNDFHRSDVKLIKSWSLAMSIFPKRFFLLAYLTHSTISWTEFCAVLWSTAQRSQGAQQRNTFCSMDSPGWQGLNISGADNKQLSLKNELFKYNRRKV